MLYTRIGTHSLAHSLAHSFRRTLIHARSHPYTDTHTHTHYRKECGSVDAENDMFFSIHRFRCRCQCIHPINGCDGAQNTVSDYTSKWKFVFSSPTWRTQTSFKWLLLFSHYFISFVGFIFISFSRLTFVLFRCRDFPLLRIDLVLWSFQPKLPGVLEFFAAIYFATNNCYFIELCRCDCDFLDVLP